MGNFGGGNDDDSDDELQDVAPEAAGDAAEAVD
jgi:hypothetical protein